MNKEDCDALAVKYDEIIEEGKMRLKDSKDNSETIKKSAFYIKGDGKTF